MTWKKRCLLRSNGVHDISSRNILRLNREIKCEEKNWNLVEKILLLKMKKKKNYKNTGCTWLGNRLYVVSMGKANKTSGVNTSHTPPNTCLQTKPSLCSSTRFTSVVCDLCFALDVSWSCKSIRFYSWFKCIWVGSGVLRQAKTVVCSCYVYKMW